MSALSDRLWPSAVMRLLLAAVLPGNGTPANSPRSSGAVLGAGGLGFAGAAVIG